MPLVSKVYFPRIILPFATVFRDLFDALILVAILIVIALIFGFPPTFKLILVPLLLVFVTLFSVTIGLWLAGALVKMRDVRPLMTIVLQVGFYFSPILFPPSLLPQAIMPFYQLNPMYWAIEISRWIFTGHDVTLTLSFYISILMVTGFFVSGLFVFSRQEKDAVDVQ